MACIKKQRYGHCSHYQCPYSDIVGVECVEIIKEFCEWGKGCVKQCPYSWEMGTERAEEAQKAFDELISEIE